jgi:hypothetical protein
MASTPGPNGNQLWNIINQPLVAGIILAAWSVIMAGIFSMSSKLNEISDRQREGLIEVKNLTGRVTSMETKVDKHDRDILVINYRLNTGK